MHRIWRCAPQTAITLCTWGQNSSLHLTGCGAQVCRKTSKCISAFPRGREIKERLKELQDLERERHEYCSEMVWGRPRVSASLLLLSSEWQVWAVQVGPLPWGCVMTTENGEQREQEVAWTDLKASDMRGWVKGTSVGNRVAWRYSHLPDVRQESVKNRLCWFQMMCWMK